MTNHQSNIIFYTILSLIITGVIIQIIHPEFYENLSKSKQERSIIEAMKKGDHNQALVSYQQLIEKRINNDNANNAETAAMYEDMAKLYSLTGNKTEEKNHYLKSLNIKQQLHNNDLFAFANTYFQLGMLAESDQQYDQAQRYYEQALSKRLGDITDKKNEGDGFSESMRKSRLEYIRLNNEGTIDTYKKLAAIHAIKKEYTTAKSYYKDALAASKVTFGEDNPKTLEIENLLNGLSR